MLYDNRKYDYPFVKNVLPCVTWAWLFGRCLKSASDYGLFINISHVRRQPHPKYLKDQLYICFETTIPYPLCLRYRLYLIYSKNINCSSCALRNNVQIKYLCLESTPFEQDLVTQASTRRPNFFSWSQQNNCPILIAFYDKEVLGLPFRFLHHNTYPVEMFSNSKYGL